MPRQPKGGHHLWPHPSLQHTQCTVLAVARAGHQLHWRHPSKLQVGAGRRAARGRACLCTHSGSCPVPSLPLPVSTSGCTSRAWCKDWCGVVWCGVGGREGEIQHGHFSSAHHCLNVCARACARLTSVLPAGSPMVMLVMGPVLSTLSHTYQSVGRLGPVV